MCHCVFMYMYAVLISCLSICMQRLKGLSGGGGSGGEDPAVTKFHSVRLSLQVKDRADKADRAVHASSHTSQPLVNGLPSHSLPVLPLQPLMSTQPYTIEIDPSSKPSLNSSSSTEPSGGNFCLPSPLQSILGPIRTLHIFNESSATLSHRPVRQVRLWAAN